ncbi:hypothetical protein HAX54_052109, partial [Datura stramonium]|nr:hypothetical protein [Datura stramonium]
RERARGGANLGVLKLWWSEKRERGREGEVVRVPGDGEEGGVRGEAAGHWRKWRG